MKINMDLETQVFRAIIKLKKEVAKKELNEYSFVLSKCPPTNPYFNHFLEKHQEYMRIIRIADETLKEHGIE